MTQLWDDARILAWRADVIAQCNAEHAPTSQALSELPYVMMQEYNAELADLRAKLAAAQAELHDLRIHAGLADQGWQPLTEDDEPVRCACCDDDCNTEAWIEQGILCLEDADGMRVSFDLGEDYAFMRRAGIAAAAT